MSLRLKFFLFFSLVFLFFAPHLSLAVDYTWSQTYTSDSFLDQIIGNPFEIDIVGGGDQNVFVILAGEIIELAVTVMGGIFVLMFIVGGYLYIFSAGNEERARSGKKTLTWAVIGSIVAISANVISNTLKYLGNEVSATADLEAAIDVIVNYLLNGVMAAAVLFIIVGGIQMIASHGNTEQVKRGKKTLLYSIIGLVAVLLSKVIFNALYSFLIEVLN